MDGEAQTTGWEVGPTAPDPEPGEPDWRRYLWGLAIALFIGVGVRLWWLSTVDTQPVTDFDWYFERARGLVMGLGYAVDGEQTAYWPVGYPGVLAAVFSVFGTSVWVGKVLNTVLTLAAIALAWRLALILFRDHRVANGVALILAVHPAYVAYSGILASEPLYTFLSLYGVAGILAYPTSFRNWLFASAAALGLAVLVRPQALLVPLIACVCRRWDAKTEHRRQTLRVLATVYVVVVVVLVPWTLRNQTVFGQPVFVSTNGGDNLLIGNSPRATGRYLNPNELGYDLQVFGEVDRDRAATRFALSYLASHKSRTVSLWPAKLAGTFLSATDAPYWAFQKSKGRLAPPGTGSDKAFFKGFRSYSEVFTFWLLAFAGLGLALTLVNRRRVRTPVTGLFLIAYSALLSLVFFGNPRFAFPVVPFLAMHACHGFVVAWDSLLKSRHKRMSSQQPVVADRSVPPDQAVTLGWRNS